MNDADIKKSLEKLKLQLQQQESEFQKINSPLELDQSRLGRLSRMDAMQVQQMELETSRRRLAQIMRIDGALKRLKTDDFGLCFVCGDELDERRLALDPTTTRCISCVEE